MDRQKPLAEKVMENIAGRLSSDNDTYTGENGLLYCSKCNTPRQVQVDMPNGSRVFNCMCRCMTERCEREREEHKRSQRMMKIERYRSIALDDEEMRNARFENDNGANKKASMIMRRYKEEFETMRKRGKGILLYGPVGTGKSFLAACVVNALIDEGHPCIMTNLIQIEKRLSAMRGYEQEIIDDLCSFDLIALDDLGAERDTETMSERVLWVIDSLCRAKKPIIVTSNYTPRQLTQADDMRRARIFDRLLRACYPVEMNGVSQRKEIGRQEYKEFKELLERE